MDDIQSIAGDVPLRVLVADRAGSYSALSQILAEHDDIEIVGSAAKAIEALSLVEKLQPDIVLLDIDMPGGDTLPLILSLIKRNRRVPAVVILVPYASSFLRERSLDAGADYVFAKTSGAEHLIDALEKIVRSQRKRVSIP